MTNKKNGVLYTGMTDNLTRRVYEHKENITPGFTTRYCLYKLVYYESTDDVTEALEREKRIKKWRRQWKIDLIEKDNPDWDDLYEHF